MVGKIPCFATPPRIGDTNRTLATTLDPLLPILFLAITSARAWEKLGVVCSGGSSLPRHARRGYTGLVSVFWLVAGLVPERLSGIQGGCWAGGPRRVVYDAMCLAAATTMEEVGGGWAAVDEEGSGGGNLVRLRSIALGNTAKLGSGRQVPCLFLFIVGWSSMCSFCRRGA
jgi:hypothetical protein